MKNQKNTRTSILVALLLGLLVFGYKMVFVQPVDEFSQAENVVASTRINAILNQIQSINFDTSIMNDPKVKSLNSIETPLPTLPVGKQNPFSN